MVWIISGIFAINHGRRFLSLITMLNNWSLRIQLLPFSPGSLTCFYPEANYPMDMEQLWFLGLLPALQTKESVFTKWCHFFFFFFTFKRRTISLQCCVGFFHITAWISHMISAISYIWSLPLEPVSPNPILPLQVITEHQPELPPMSYLFYMW